MYFYWHGSKKCVHYNQVSNVFFHYLQEAEDSPGSFSASVRIQGQIRTRGNVQRTDVGYGSVEKARSPGRAAEQADKKAVTDAIKRTARQLGYIFSCGYDEHYQNYVASSIRPSIAFTYDQLYHHPDVVADAHNTGTVATVATGSKPLPRPLYVMLFVMALFDVYHFI